MTVSCWIKNLQLNPKLRRSSGKEVVFASQSKARMFEAEHDPRSLLDARHLLPTQKNSQNKYMFFMCCCRAAIL